MHLSLKELQLQKADTGFTLNNPKVRCHRNTLSSIRHPIVILLREILHTLAFNSVAHSTNKSSSNQNLGAEATHKFPSTTGKELPGMKTAFLTTQFCPESFLQLQLENTQSRGSEVHSEPWEQSPCLHVSFNRNQFVSVYNFKKKEISICPTIFDNIYVSDLY